MWTVLEVFAVVMIAAGVWLSLGLGWGLVVAGGLILWLSWMAGGDE